MQCVGSDTSLCVQKQNCRAARVYQEEIKSRTSKTHSFEDLLGDVIDHPL